MAAKVQGPVAHHFNNLNQQLTTVRFGMWLFLVTEILFFGGAFCAYAAYRVWYPRDFEAGSAALNVGIASVREIIRYYNALAAEDRREERVIRDLRDWREHRRPDRQDADGDRRRNREVLADLLVA